MSLVLAAFKLGLLFTVVHTGHLLHKARHDTTNEVPLSTGMNSSCSAGAPTLEKLAHTPMYIGQTELHTINYKE